MIWVRLTHEELSLLRRGQTRSVEVPLHAGGAAPGEDTPVRAYAVAERKDGAIVRRRAAVRCRVVAVERASSAWLVTYAPGAVGKPRFLTARPGKRGDYTADVRYAMRDEPECVPESWERRAERVARQTAQPPTPDRRPWRRPS